MRDKIVLHCKEGAHDKVYILWQENKGPNGEGVDLWTVEARWGRRAGSSQTGTKTAAPAPEAAADLVFDKTHGEKLRKGYKEDPDVDPFNIKRDAARGFIKKWSEWLRLRASEPNAVLPVDVVHALDKGEGSAGLIRLLSDGSSSRVRVLAKDFYDANREAFAVLILEVTSG